MLAFLVLGGMGHIAEWFDLPAGGGILFVTVGLCLALAAPYIVAVPLARWLMSGDTRRRRYDASHVPEALLPPPHRSLPG